jgi:hypothetical protein
VPPWPFSPTLYLKTPDDNTVALLLTMQHMLWEMERDVFFLSPTFAAGDDFRGARSGWPSSVVELHKTWGRLLEPTTADEEGLVGALPPLVESLDDESVDRVCAVCGKSPLVAPTSKDDLADSGPNKAIGSLAGAQVSPACRLCKGYEEYYAAMYAKPVTVSVTTCSSCGSRCEECEMAENLF